MGLKVLHLIDSGGLYGAEKMLLILVAEQLRQGMEPLILSVGPASNEEKAIVIEAKRLKLPVKHWNMRPGLNLLETWKLIRWAQQNDFDIAHSHGYKFNILLGLIPKALRKLKFVSTLHGYTATQTLSKLGLYQKLDGIALKKADAVILVASSMAERFSTWRTVRIIPNGLPSGREIGGEIPHNIGPYFIGVGRLSKEKAFDRLIKSFALYVTADGDKTTRLIIAGDGPERMRLEDLTRQLNLDSRVSFIGFTTNAVAKISNALALAIPSDTEGLPLVLLEAMRAGTPVVSTPVGEIPRALEYGEHGYIAADMSPRAFAEKLLDLKNNTEMSIKRAKSAIKRFESTYTSGAMADSYASVYRDLLKNNWVKS